MSSLDPLVGLVSRIRPSWLFPSLSIGAEGGAKLCTSAHPMILPLEGPERTGSLHLDVELDLWNKSRIPVTVFEPVDATACGQRLLWKRRGYWGAFKEATLGVGGGRQHESFRLDPPDGEELRAQVGDRVILRLRLNSGRPRKVKLPITERRP